MNISVIYFKNIVSGPHLIDGRSRMVEENKGRRCKLETRDGNYIDTMFVDRRSR